MKTKFIIISVLSVFLISGCSKLSKASSVSSVAVSQVEFITPQFIGRLTPVSISFKKSPECPIGQGLEISPKIKGTWEYSDNKATFTPAQPYKANSKLTLKANLKKLFNEDCGDFIQDFYVESPSYSVEFDEIRLDASAPSYKVSGSVTTDIPVTQEVISKVLNASLSSKKQEVSWKQSDTPQKWNFSVDVQDNQKKDRTLELKWSGKELGMNRAQTKLFDGKKLIPIPGQDDFSIIDINTQKDNTILVSFSKTLDPSQDITSFVKASDKNGRTNNNFTASIHGNNLLLFSDSNWNNIQTVDFQLGIQSSDGIYLAKADSVTLSDNWEIPKVRFMNSNVILPTSQGAVFPIETMNLTGVIVQVYQIYERNMNQFLQDNELDGTYNLAKVGEPVWEKKINFDWNNSMQNKYIARGLDLSTLVKKYSGGMYHIRVSFRKDQIKYVCKSSHDFSDLPMPPDSIEEYSVPTNNEKSSWDYYENVNYKQRQEYWSYRNDPCHPAFYVPSYNSSSVISRNVLVSDIGIMAKKDNTGTLFITTSDLKTSKPLSNVSIELKSYVGTTITTGKTNSDGQVIIKTTKEPYSIIAKNSNQTSYLAIGKGTNLSTSHFEIGGEKVTNGLKGYIYGERGVWRPGDELFLTFVLQDLEKNLPANIPVTFELMDPLGHITDTQVLTDSQNGFYPITTKTADNATTGLWTGRVTIGGNTWTKYLSIESIVPNRLSVELTSITDYLSGSNNRFNLKGAWLHGAEVPNYKADVSVAFSETSTDFDGYSEYTFTNILNDINYSREEIWSGELNANSEASFSAYFNPGQNLPGKLRANFVSRIYEPSGAFSTQSTSMDYYPFDRYVGIKLPKGDATRNMLLTDTDHTVDTVLLTQSGAPVSSANLTYTVYKLEWKWWWEKDAYTSATYVSSRYYNKVASGSFDVKNGKGSFKFSVKYPDWGRYLVEVKDGSRGHCASQIVYIDWPGWAGRAQEGGTGSAAMLPLTADQKSYTVGQTAKISFESSAQATAYICIEEGGKLIKSLSMETKKGTNVYSLKLTKDMSPNIYVHLSLIQPHMQTANSLPIRLYGVIPVMVDDPETVLKPVIKVADTLEPNKTASFTVSENSGKAMTYTLAVVDEGLLGLTNFHGPDLKSEFYKKEASELENWDIYRYIINAYSGKLETMLAIGGSEDILNNAKNNENRFAPVVRYFGPYTIKAGEKKTTEFEMPYYVGAVRAIVVAGNSGAYGTAEKSVPVKSALMAQPVFPRTMGTNETVQIPVTVFNGENFEKKVSVNFAGRGILNFSKTENVTVPANANVVVNFEVATKNPGHVLFETTAKDSANNTKNSTPVDIMSRGIPVTYSSNFVVKPGATVSVSTSSPSEKGATLKVELSTLQQINFSGRLDYLIEYPHGCIEQITSGGFPQLYLSDFTYLSPEKNNQIKNNVMSVIERYPTYQTSSGAMGYWPGNSSPHAWGTCYATHFMTEAKKHGYSVPDTIYQPALTWLENTSDEWQYSRNDETNAVQAYRLFVLALAGKANIGAMNRLLADSGLTNEAKLLLSGAYSLAGRKQTAQDLLDGIGRLKSAFRNTGGDFSSSIRQKGLELFAATLIDSKSSTKSDTLAKEIADTLSSDKWLSTQETAWLLFSLLPYYSNKKTSEGKYTVWNNIDEKSGSFKEKAITESLTFSTKFPGQNISVKNTGDATLYGTMICSGISAPGTESVQNNTISMSATGLDKLKKIKSGEEVSLKIHVSNPTASEIKNIVLTIPVGTCLEFANERLANAEYRSSDYTYQDIRDNVIYTYFDLNAKASKDFYFTVTAAYNGNFVVPAIYAQAMYDDSIKAVIPGFTVIMLK